MTRWAILTGEYPPDPGGVSDYTRLVACGLVSAGDEVRVYAPPTRGGASADDPGVGVHRLGGRFGPRSLQELDRLLSRRPRPDRILVQYVPHAFGYKAMNLPFVAWCANRLPRMAPFWVMFHEVAFPLTRWPLSHGLLAITTRAMARVIAGAAERVFVTIPAWGRVLKRLCPRSKPAEWLPVPCSIAIGAEPVAIATVHKRFNPLGGNLVGHFGAFGGAAANLLRATTIELLRLEPNTGLLLIGRDSEAFRVRLMTENPSFATRIHATDELASKDVAAHMQACDLLLQPYPDGISSRRTSTMAGLANGVPVVTNLGDLSERLWTGGAVVAAPAPNPAAIAQLAVRLLRDPSAREVLSRKAVELYREQFALENTIARLREEAS